MLGIIGSDEAKEIVDSFKLPGKEWIEKSMNRIQVYSEIINTGNRKEISKIVNILMRKKHEAEINGKKLTYQDQKLLTSVQNIMFNELAISLNTTFEAIYKEICSLMKLK